jgi:hypothetical protein
MACSNRLMFTFFSPRLREVHERRCPPDCSHFTLNCGKQDGIVQRDGFSDRPDSFNKPEPDFKRLRVGQRDAIFGEQMLEFFQPLSRNHCSKSSGCGKSSKAVKPTSSVIFPALALDTRALR